MSVSVNIMPVLLAATPSMPERASTCIIEEIEDDETGQSPPESNENARLTGFLHPEKTVIDTNTSSDHKLESKPVLDTSKRLVLTMIVKNESNIIARCLNSCLPILDAIVISDTGSTDNTKQVIIDTVEKFNREQEEKQKNLDAKSMESMETSEYSRTKSVKLSIQDCAWKDFGYNRTQGLRQTQKVIQDVFMWSLENIYMLLLDADMLLNIHKWDIDDLKIPNLMLEQKTPMLGYWNTRLIQASYNWVAVGKTHEFYAVPKEDVPKSSETSDNKSSDQLNAENKYTELHKGYYSGLSITDANDGNNRAEKHNRDIQLLLDEISEMPDNARSWFYLAQSHQHRGELAMLKQKEQLQTVLNHLNKLDNQPDNKLDNKANNASKDKSDTKSDTNTKSVLVRHRDKCESVFQQFIFRDDFHQAIKCYQKYLTLSKWPEEIWYAQYSIGVCYMHSEMWPEALSNLLQAYQMRPIRSEPLMRLVEYYFNNQQFHLSLMYLRTAALIPFPNPLTDTLFIERALYEFVTMYFISLNAGMIGDYGLGQYASRLLIDKGHQIPPNLVENIKHNYRYYLDALPVKQKLKLESSILTESKLHVCNPSMVFWKNRLIVNCRGVNYTMKHARDYQTPDGIVRTANALSIFEPNKLASLKTLGGLIPANSNKSEKSGAWLARQQRETDSMAAAGATTANNSSLTSSSSPIWKCEKEIPVVQLPISKYADTSIIKGHEDVRLFVWNDKLWYLCTSVEEFQITTPEGQTGCIPQICLAQLDALDLEPEPEQECIETHRATRQIEISSSDGKSDHDKFYPKEFQWKTARVQNYTLLKRQDSDRPEKNWLPFVYRDQVCFIYSYAPFLVLQYDIATKQTQLVKNEVWPIDGTHMKGSCAPIQIPGSTDFLMMVHYTADTPTERIYFHRFIVLNNKLDYKMASEMFHLGHPGQVEMCLSMMTNPKNTSELLIGLGVEDREAYMLISEWKSIIKFCNETANKTQIFAPHLVLTHMTPDQATQNLANSNATNASKTGNGSNPKA